MHGVRYIKANSIGCQIGKINALHKCRLFAVIADCIGDLKRIRRVAIPLRVQAKGIRNRQRAMEKRLQARNAHITVYIRGIRRNAGDAEAAHLEVEFLRHVFPVSLGI